MHLEVQLREYTVAKIRGRVRSGPWVVVNSEVDSGLKACNLGLQFGSFFLLSFTPRLEERA